MRSTFVQVEPRMSQTGANADEWVPAKPGTEGVLALGLAHVLLSARLRPADAAGRAGALIDGWSAGLTAYTPAEVEKRTGVAAARIERVARALVEQRPGVAMIGGAPLAQTNGLFAALAVNALNALLGSVGQPGGVFFMPQMAAPAQTRQPSAPERRTVQAMAADILGKDPSPVGPPRGWYQIRIRDPPGWRAREALLKVPSSPASAASSTRRACSISFCPTIHFSNPGLKVVRSLVRRPCGDARAPSLETAPSDAYDARCAAQVAARKPLDFPWKTFDEMLMAALPPCQLLPQMQTPGPPRGSWW